MNNVPATPNRKPVRPRSAAYGHTTAQQRGAAASVLHERFMADGTKEGQTELLEDFIRGKSDNRSYLILHGDAFDLIDQLPADSIDLAITSLNFHARRLS